MTGPGPPSCHIPQQPTIYKDKFISSTNLKMGTHSRISLRQPTKLSKMSISKAIKHQFFKCGPPYGNDFTF